MAPFLIGAALVLGIIAVIAGSATIGVVAIAALFLGGAAVV